MSEFELAVTENGRDVEWLPAGEPRDATVTRAELVTHWSVGAL